MKFQTCIKFAPAVLVTLAVLIIVGCFPPDPEPVLLTCAEINEKLEQLDQLQQSTATPTPVNVGAPQIEDDGTYICQTQTIEWAPVFEELFLLDPRTDIIYTGSILDGSSVASGAYTPILINARKPIELSISAATQPGMSPKIKIETPNLGNIREGVNTLIQRVVEGSSNADVNFDMMTVRSSEELALFAGINIESNKATLSTLFNFTSQEERSRTLVKFHQKYYTIDLTTPGTACDMIGGVYDNDPAFDQGVSPVYVNSVSYGRLAYFLVESSADASALEAALQATFNAGAVGIGASVSTEQKTIIEQSKIVALIKGGNADYAVNTIAGLQGLIDYLTADGDFSVASPGIPIAYTMRYLGSNSVAKVVMNTQYNVRTCEIKGEPLTVTLNNNNGAGYYYCATHVSGEHEGDADFYGNGPKVEGQVSLEVKNGNQIYAKIDYTWTEMGGDGTKGYVTETVPLYTLPAGKQFLSFEFDPHVFVDYQDTNTSIDFPGFSGGDFIEKIQVMGDGQGNDFNCDGDKDAHVKIFFKPFNILVKPN